MHFYLSISVFCYFDFTTFLRQILYLVCTTFIPSFLVTFQIQIISFHLFETRVLLTLVLKASCVYTFTGVIFGMLDFYWSKWPGYWCSAGCSLCRGTAACGQVLQLCPLKIPQKEKSVYGLSMLLLSYPMLSRWLPGKIPYGFQKNVLAFSW